MENLEKQVFDLSQLLEISKGLNSTLDYNQLLDSILFTCMGQMRVLNAGVFTRRELYEGDYTLHRNYKGFDLDHEEEYIITAENPVISVLSTNLKTFSLTELDAALSTPSVKGDSADDSLHLIRSLDPALIVPLTTQRMLHGFLILGNRIGESFFSETEKEYLQHIAVFAAIAVHNAYLFEMATTDMMTKLKTRHFFETALDEYLHGQRQLKKTISLMLLDIDHFKKINDQYGHVYGDAVIIETATLIKQNIRQNDIAARYGGEEFVVVLPDADSRETYEIAERIRKAVEQITVPFQDKTISATISIGIAEFSPAMDQHRNIFVDRADAALYKSKKEGRNRTTQGS